MSISIDWYNSEKTILQVTFEGVWTIDEFLDTIKATNAFTSDGVNAPEQISIIVNLEKTGGIPRGVSVLPHFRYALTKLNYQYLIIAGGTSFGLALVRIVSKAVPDKIRRIFIESNVNEAVKRIENQRVASTH